MKRQIKIPGYRVSKTGAIVKDRKRLNLCAQLSRKKKTKIVKAGLTCPHNDEISMRTHHEAREES